VVAGAFFLTGVFVWITSGYTGSVAALFWLTFITGIFLTAALTSMPVLAATYYPTRGRASGVAWMLGIGRFGGIAGALAGGPLLSAGFGVGNILALLAIPSFISAAALLGKAYLEARSSRVDHPIGIDLEPTAQ
jgi:AAHS family 4-hydroxybenzoate transporter-like MFS transporter